MDWERILGPMRLDYSGDIVMSGQDVTWARIEPGLPPPGLAGAVDALALCAPPLRPWLREPRLSVLGASGRADCGERASAAATPNGTACCVDSTSAAS